MKNVETIDIYNALEREVLKLLKKNKESLSSKQDELNETDPEKIPSFFDKIILKRDIKNYEEQVRKLAELKQKLSSLDSVNSDGYELPQALLNELKKLGSLLEKNEVEELRNNLSDAFKTYNEPKKNAINEYELEIKKLLTQLKLNEQRIRIYDYSVDDDRKNTYEDLVTILSREKRNELSLKYMFISSRSSEETYLTLDEEQRLNDLEEIRTNGRLIEDERVKEIIANYSKIKNAFYERAKAREIASSTTSAISDMQDITEVNFKQMIGYLQKLNDNYKKVVDANTKLLNKYNLDYAKEQIYNSNHIKEEKDLRQFEYNKYKDLSYELEKTMIENPRNYEKIQSIKEQMENLANKLGLSKDIREKAFNEGKKEYRKYDELKKNNPVYTMESLREFAISELKKEKAFNKDVDMETLIINKIDELVEFANMTPEERGLLDWKKDGLLKEDATIKDLSPQQINDFRTGYSDGAYTFIKEYKEKVKRGIIKPSTRTIYGEYTRYLATLEDKSTKMSFQQFAKEKYGLENVNISMNEDETRGKSR